MTTKTKKRSGQRAAVLAYLLASPQDITVPTSTLASRVTLMSGIEIKPQTIDNLRSDLRRGAVPDSRLNVALRRAIATMKANGIQRVAKANGRPAAQPKVAPNATPVELPVVLDETPDDTADQIALEELQRFNRQFCKLCGEFGGVGRVLELSEILKNLQIG